MKKLFAIVLTLVMVLSMSVTAFATEIDNNAYADGTNTANVTVTYNASEANDGASNEETWTATIPATATAGGNAQDVVVSGSFSPAKTLIVTAPDTVELYINGDTSKDKVVLAVTFNDVALAGSYKEASVSTTKTISIADMSNIKFGSWSGTLVFSIDMTDTEGYTASDVLSQ